ncbi:hypothetical protein KUTeg_013102 [Tegillarca granosa]|uniref:Uncharacterized protein n=1 Tax=Tegillarca granosa TaxID=220873 RepID=A0ABQ9ESQ6_TEGGR|nr:hypothetical protein KUTeg_013102 [Tegillarca granosa]
MSGEENTKGVKGVANDVPGYTGETYPDVFNINGMPKQPKEKKPGQLPEEMIRQFFKEGYMIVEDFFKREELDACREDIKNLVDDLAQKLYDAGKIKKLYRDSGLFERLTLLEKEFPGTNIILHKLGVMPEAVRKLWSNERLLNVVEQLIGSDIMGHPVWNLRTKTPQNEATTVPWHQDAGYLATDSYNVLQPTAWIPLLDTNETNGCLQIAVGGHKKGQVAVHQCCYGGTWYVMLEEDEMAKRLDVDLEKDLKICPIPYGGMLMFNNLLPHQSLPNLSKDVRWSLDLRWQKPQDPLGFYGLKEGVLMRSSKDPNLEIDWESFNAVDRNKKQIEYMTGKEAEEFDTTIQGPWMKKWEIVHVNRHVDAHFSEENSEKWTKA